MSSFLIVHPNYMAAHFDLKAQIFLQVRGGVVSETKIFSSANTVQASREEQMYRQALNGKDIHHIRDFRHELSHIGDQALPIGAWLNKMFGLAG